MQNTLFNVKVRENHSDRTKTLLDKVIIVLAKDKKDARKIVRKEEGHWKPEIKSVTEVKIKRGTVFSAFIN